MAQSHSAPQVAEPVEAAAARDESPNALDAARAHEPPPPVKVLVVDDELVGNFAAKLRELAPDFVSELRDLTSPTAEQIWGLCRAAIGFAAIDEMDLAEVETFLASDAFVTDVVLSPAFRAVGFLGLGAFYHRVGGVLELRQQIQEAYPSPEFVVDFRAERPPLADVLGYSLVIFDLVLPGSARPVEELVSYLKDLADSHAGELPCLIVLSSRQELIEKKVVFSAGSSISAAGLLLLQKSQVREARFGASGLRLSYQLLHRQRAVAQRMRVFMFEWTSALQKATTQANETLWNLDAATMQDIHLTAFSDNDPYDEHLNVLVAREHVWHVESQPGVLRAIKELSACFDENVVAGSNSLKHRFMAPFVPTNAARDVFSHYTWSGFDSSFVFSGDAAKEKAGSHLHRVLPFGAVLGPSPVKSAAGEKSQMLVHLTQQCDLNSSMRTGDKAGKRNFPHSLTFAIAYLVEVNDRHPKPAGEKSLAAPGIKIDGTEYDLHLQSGSVLSLPVEEFIKYAMANTLRVVGRLRHDIALNFLNAVANHLTRPASLKMTVKSSRQAWVVMYGTGTAEARPFLNSNGEPHVVDVTVNPDDTHAFSGDTCLWLSIWIKTELAAAYGRTEIDSVAVCNTLSVGVKDKGLVASVLTLKISPISSATALPLPAEIRAEARPKLVIVFQE